MSSDDRAVPELLTSRLRSLRWRVLSLGVLSGLGTGLCSGTLVVIGIAWLDTLAETSPLVRISALTAAGLAVAVGLLATLVAAGLRSTDRALAARLDATLQSGGVVTSGIDLLLAPGPLANRPPPSGLDRVAGSAAEPGGIVRDGGPFAALIPPPKPPTGSPSGLTRGLERLAIVLAGEVSARASSSRVAPIRAAVRPLGVAALLAAAVAAAAGLWPDLARTQLLRLTDPHGDHPPHSPTALAVHPGATTVLYGDSLDVSARCTGLLPDRMELVICDASGTPGQSVPMFQEDESRWRSQIQDVRHRLEYFVRTPHGRSHRYPIDVTLVPRILQVRVRLTPPGYTGDPPYDGPVPPGGISAVRGSLVDVVVDSNRPLASGELCLFSPRLAPVRVSLVPDRTDPRSVRGRFELRQSGQLRIQVVDARGLASREPFRTSLGVTDDQRPTVQIVSPLPRSVVAPDSVLPVGVEAVDDFGVARITLFRSLNASRHLPVDLPVRGGRARLARSVVSMDLSAYGLLPGDVMTLFARAVDDEPGRPKGSETPIVEVSVVSPAEFARLVKARQSLGSFEVKYRETQRILDTVLESLQRHADQLEDAIARGDETLAGTVIGEMERSARALERSVDWMQSELEAPRELDLDQALRIHLATLRERLTGFRRTLIAARSTARAKALAALRQLLADLASAREEFTRNVTQPLDVLDIVFPLMTDAERFSELAAIQRELARRIESAGDVGANDGYGDRVRLVDLAEEQRRVRAELATLLEDIRDDAAKLPEDEPFGRLKREAVAFASSVARGPIPDLMDRAASALEKNDAKAGGRSATAAANEMEKLIKRCTEVSDQAERCLRFQPTLARSLGDTIRQLLAGQGSGKGGPGGGLHGYSMRDPRRALGLYGKVVLSEARQQGASTAGARGSGEGAHPPTRLDDSGGSGDDHVPAAGVPARELPPAYRQQIRHYLERLAEELAGGRR